jgi:hypothetical protein
MTHHVQFPPYLPALVLPALYPARISASSSLLAATMNQKSSVPQVASFVSQALKRDRRNCQPLLEPVTVLR